jgi:hypothetical protein
MEGIEIFKDFEANGISQKDLDRIKGKKQVFIKV